jgi:hypothetical protein
MMRMQVALPARAAQELPAARAACRRKVAEDRALGRRKAAEDRAPIHRKVETALKAAHPVMREQEMRVVVAER